MLLLKKTFSYCEVFKKSVADCYEILLRDLKQDLSEFRVMGVHRAPTVVFQVHISCAKP